MTTSMGEEDYLEQRLQDQLDWYERKSSYYQHRYKRLRLIEILCAAIIPFLSGFVTHEQYGDWFAYGVGILGIVIAISAAIASLGKYHEQWIQYRSTAEQLKHEKFLFLTKTEPYDDDERFTMMVQRIEGLISKENSNWAQLAAKQGKLPANKKTS